VKRPSDPAVQDVDVGDGRDREAVAAHHAQQLVLLARVVADLADHEGSAAAHLERQLEVLGDQLALEALDVGTAQPRKKVWSSGTLSAAARWRPPLPSSR
jgi:hypothetical protein